jgi:hypothetical protein
MVPALSVSWLQDRAARSAQSSLLARSHPPVTERRHRHQKQKIQHWGEVTLLRQTRLQFQSLVEEQSLAEKSNSSFWRPAVMQLHGSTGHPQLQESSTSPSKYSGQSNWCFCLLSDLDQH